MGDSSRKKHAKRLPPEYSPGTRFREICRGVWLFFGLPEIRPLFPRKERAPKKPPTETAITGAWGEKRAADYLRRKGYRILGRNVRFGSDRELDLVARSPDPPTLVFVEVKTRRDESRGRPFCAVDGDKRRALVRAAAMYLRKLRRRPTRVRFDVVEVVGHPDSPAPPVLRHIENAFTLPGNDRLPV